MSFNQNRVRLYSASGNLLFDVPSGVSSPTAVVETAEGDLLVGGINGGIARLDGETGALLPDPFPEVPAPGLGFDRDGDLLVVNVNGTSVTKYDGQTGALLGSVATGVSGIVYDGEVGPDGKFYFADAFGGADGIYQLDYEAGGPAVLFASSSGLIDPLGFGFVGDELYVPDFSSQNVFRFVGPEGIAVEELTLTGSLAAGTCPANLPLGRFSCRVDASGTFNGDQGQRYTVFLRVAETGRIAFRGEVKPQPGQTVEQSIKFVTIADDSDSFTLELIAVEGSVGSPDGGTVLGTLDFTKGTPLLRAAEGLTAFPNPATDAATLRFAVAEQTEATLVVYDALGREVARPVEGTVSGAVEASFDASALPAGLYVARLTTAQGTETVRLSVVR